MDTSFRDGFQSVYGARVITEDFIPALEAAVDAGTSYFEAGGGARFQSLFFYCNESAFDMMDRIRAVTGPEANLQTLARGINVVALNQQPRDIIDLHAKMFKKHGMTTIRNFDALNDIRNLKYSGERIAHHGLKHQIVITIMDLPPGCKNALTSEFYLDRLQKILDSDIPFDSICFKDSSGTTNPQKVYETIRGARKMVSEKTTLHMHTHDTAGLGTSQYLAAILGGIDCVDLAMNPVSGGTSQPDILSLLHMLKGTEFTLDVDYEKILHAEEVFADCMKNYFVPPEAKKTSANITLSPMPGGALTANTMMMRDTGTLHLYPKVIKELGNVVRLGGYGTSVTPVSQFYFQQAYLNVTQGVWKKINPNYGNMVLGYFGRTPFAPDPDIVKLASEQLKKDTFEGDPLDVLEPQIPKVTKTLQENKLPVTDENIFIVSCCEGKGLDFLQGKGKQVIRKNEDEKPASKAAAPQESPKTPAGPKHYSINVDGRNYQVSVNEAYGVQPKAFAAAPAPVEAANPENETDVMAPTPGNIMSLEVNMGDPVHEGDTLLVMEAMKMETEIKAPSSGTISAIHVGSGDVVQTSDLLVTLRT